MNDTASLRVSGADARAERDRFVAFAFTAADVFIETDGQLNVIYATGALRWLFGGDGQCSSGQNLGQFLSTKSTKLINAACLLAKREGRFAALPMTVERNNGRTVKAEVCGIYLPAGRGTFHFSIRSCASTFLAIAGNNLPQPIEDTKLFASKTAEVAKIAREVGEDVSLTMIHLGGIVKVERHAYGRSL